jgi:hypothetical protein
MASNIKQGGINLPVINVDLSVTVSTSGHTTSPKSGDGVIAGSIPGVALGDKDTVTGLTPVCTQCIAVLPVNGITAGGGNAAISAGDVLYMQTDGTIDKNSSASGAVKFGVAFGNDFESSALGTDTRTGQLVASGGVATSIRVWVGKLVG